MLLPCNADSLEYVCRAAVGTVYGVARRAYDGVVAADIDCETEFVAGGSVCGQYLFFQYPFVIAGDKYVRSACILAVGIVAWRSDDSVVHIEADGISEFGISDGRPYPDLVGIGTSEPFAGKIAEVGNINAAIAVIVTGDVVGAVDFVCGCRKDDRARRIEGNS